VNSLMDDKTLQTIEKRLARLEDAVFGRKGARKSASKPKAEAKASGFSGATGGVRFLVSKGLFKKKQGLAEVRTALSENGYHYSRQAVHVALNNLISKGGPLVSLQEGGRKVYVERK
jgi:hypothetical protein